MDTQHVDDLSYCAEDRGTVWHAVKLTQLIKAMIEAKGLRAMPWGELQEVRGSAQAFDWLRPNGV